MQVTMRINTDGSEIVPYNLPGFPMHAQLEHLSEYANYTALGHWHDDLEWICVLSGTMHYSINGHVCVLRAGSGVFVNARQMHFGYSPNRKECEFVCIVFSPSLLCTNERTESAYVLPILGHGSFSFCPLSSSVPWQKMILNDICAAHKHLSCGDLLMVQSTLFHMWTQLYSHAPKPDTHESAAQLNSIKDMLTYIHAHYPEKIGIDEISAHAYISKSTCHQLFRRYLNKTPVRYLTEYRLAQSARMLYNTDLTISEIAYATGFSGASYFAETFKKTYNCTPVAYRKSHT